MLIAVTTSVLLACSFLLALVVCLTTGLFMARVPSGADAMGLVVPFFAGIGSWLLMLPAAWLVSGRGTFLWLSTPSMPAALVLGIAVLGLGLAGTGAFLAYGDRHAYAVPAGWIAGVLAPLAAQGLLLYAAWHGDAQPQAAWTRMLALALGLVAVGGYAWGAWQLVAQAGQSARIAVKRSEEDRRAVADTDRRAALTPAQRMAEDLAATPQAPFWHVVLRLRGEDDAAARALVVQRCEAFADLDRELDQVMAGDHVEIRAAGAQFMAMSARRHPGWAVSLSRAMVRLAQDLARVEGMASPAQQMAFAPEIEHLLATTRLFPEADFGDSIALLRTTVEAKPEDPARTRALAALDAADSSPAPRQD